MPSEGGRARRRLQQGSRLQKKLMTDAFMWEDLTTAEQELVNAFANNSLRVALVKANEAYGFNKETRPRASSIAVVQHMSRASTSSASQPASSKGCVVMNLAVRGASCRLYKQVRQFGSQDECVAFLAAWAFEGAADTQCLISSLVMY